MGFELLCPEGKAKAGDNSWTANTARLSKIQFSYVSDGDYLVCPAGRHLGLYRRYAPSGGKPACIQYRSEDCTNCPLASKCLSGKAKVRMVKRYRNDAAKEALRHKMSQPEVRRRYKQRQSAIEPVHGEQKHIQGMRRFRRRGLTKVRMEYSLHCMAHNLRRYRVLRAKQAG